MSKRRAAEREQARKERTRIAQRQAAIYDASCGLCKYNERSNGTLEVCTNCPFLAQNMVIGEQLLTVSKQDKARVRKEAAERIKKRELNVPDFLILRGEYDHVTLAKMTRMQYQQFMQWQKNNGLEGV